ncbi:MAG: virulence RhuM family protein, partial [Salinivirgaceae bacterium]|nr:virulence RhuM family protein [Salinivirgaceae bacterium]
MEPNDKIVIYQTDDGQMRIDVRMENETVWLSQQQMAALFDKDQSVIARHILNVFKEGELDEKSNMHILHNTLSKYRPTKIYSLDVIISVGYRVKSQRGTQFRIWANRVLKDYLIKGYVVNNRLSQQKFDDLRKLVGVLGRTVKAQEKLTNDEATALIDVVMNYNYALDTLDNYDYERLKINATTKTEKFRATYENAMAAIGSLKAKFGGSQLFGHEKDQSFKSSIGQIYQTFDGVELYPSVEEKAA